ncbi:unnamed protein product [Eruca vesicaria subsp. sativa]|uniref:Uncharacterized protein n=1 Tax=Eruca vesicaria subsp. sativa TaxID=29727 RepID=A0ABC8LUL8_ERUVS|nr:unnamed protein product [Eruca vesicaria subsp. sativa]
MLNLNQPPNPNENRYKILIYDEFCKKIIAPLMSVKDLLKHGVTLHSSIDKKLLTNKTKRDDVPDVAVYFVQPTESNIQKIVTDASSSPPYVTFHLNFSSSIPRTLLYTLASETLTSGSVGRFAKVHDQYLEFVSLEDNLFSLSQPSVYLQLNDPSPEEVIEKVADGVFCVLATLGVVPVIKCPRGGHAEKVAVSLDKKLREHTNLVNEGGKGFMQRPLLCIFDRDFELSVGIQHDFRYKPLVHDVLGLTKLNGGSDPFMSANGSLEFPQVAEEIETELKNYKKDVEEVNMKTNEFDGTNLIGNTKHLMNAVNSIPELTARKEMIDKHTNIATELLGEIKKRSLDVFTEKENEMMMKGGSIDMSELLDVLNKKGTKMDKLRFAIMYILSLKTMNQAEIEAVEAALREAEVDTRAFYYVKKIKSLDLSLTAAADSANGSNIVDWAEKLYDQSISAVTAGVKNLLSSDQQLAVARTVEVLTKGQPNPETDSYLMLDPIASKTGSSVNGPFREAIVFMVGGGNYIEYNSLQELSQRQAMVKNIIYGATEMLTGSEVVEQLSLLGEKMGLEET